MPERRPAEPPDTTSRDELPESIFDDESTDSETEEQTTMPGRKKPKREHMDYRYPDGKLMTPGDRAAVKADPAYFHADGRVMNAGQRAEVDAARERAARERDGVEVIQTADAPPPPRGTRKRNREDAGLDLHDDGDAPTAKAPRLSPREAPARRQPPRNGGRLRKRNAVRSAEAPSEAFPFPLPDEVLQMADELAAPPGTRKRDREAAGLDLHDDGDAPASKAPRLSPRDAPARRQPPRNGGRLRKRNAVRSAEAPSEAFPFPLPDEVLQMADELAAPPGTRKRDREAAGLDLHDDGDAPASKAPRLSPRDAPARRQPPRNGGRLRKRNAGRSTEEPSAAFPFPLPDEVLQMADVLAAPPEGRKRDREAAGLDLDDDGNAPAAKRKQAREDLAASPELGGSTRASFDDGDDPMDWVPEEHPTMPAEMSAETLAREQAAHEQSEQNNVYEMDGMEQASPESASSTSNRRGDRGFAQPEDAGIEEIPRSPAPITPLIAENMVADDSHTNNAFGAPFSNAEQNEENSGLRAETDEFEPIFHEVKENNPTEIKLSDEIRAEIKKIYAKDNKENIELRIRIDELTKKLDDLKENNYVKAEFSDEVREEFIARYEKQRSENSDFNEKIIKTVENLKKSIDKIKKNSLNSKTSETLYSEHASCNGGTNMADSSMTKRLKNIEALLLSAIEGQSKATRQRGDRARPVVKSEFGESDWETVAPASRNRATRERSYVKSESSASEDETPIRRRRAATRPVDSSGLESLVRKKYREILREAYRQEQAAKDGLVEKPAGGSVVVNVRPGREEVARSYGLEPFSEDVNNIWLCPPDRSLKGLPRDFTTPTTSTRLPVGTIVAEASFDELKHEAWESPSGKHSIKENGGFWLPDKGLKVWVFPPHIKTASLDKVLPTHLPTVQQDVLDLRKKVVSALRSPSVSVPSNKTIFLDTNNKDHIWMKTLGVPAYRVKVPGRRFPEVYYTLEKGENRAITARWDKEYRQARERANAKDPRGHLKARPPRSRSLAG